MSTSASHFSLFSCVLFPRSTEVNFHLCIVSLFVFFFSSEYAPPTEKLCQYLYLTVRDKQKRKEEKEEEEEDEDEAAIVNSNYKTTANASDKL